MDVTSRTSSANVMLMVTLVNVKSSVVVLDDRLHGTNAAPSLES